MKIKTRELKQKISSALNKSFNEEQSKLILDIVYFAEAAGKKSHGLTRLVDEDFGVLSKNPSKPPEIRDISKQSATVVGNDNPGMLVGASANKKVIELALENGVGFVGTNGTWSTSGCLSYYLYEIAKRDLVGIIMARAPKDVLLFDAKEQLAGTNPIGFALPTAGQPLIFDMATSAISYGAVLRSKMKGEKIPENVALNKEGQPTTDPAEALEGGFFPFARDYKSSGLAMMVEIFAGALVGADMADLSEENSWGNFFLAFKPDLLTDLAGFKTYVSRYIDRVKNAETTTGKPNRIVGEQSITNFLAAEESGEVEVDGILLEKLESYL